MYEEPGLYLADCMKAMKEFQDGFFDLAIVDPPYGINAPMRDMGSGASKDKKKYGTAVRLRGRLNSGAGRLSGRILNQSEIGWDNEIPPPEYFAELRRVSKNQVIFGGNYFPLPPTRGILVWDKKQPWENFSQCEIAWTSFDKPAGIFHMSNTRGGKIHPTQKPVELYEWVLRRCAKEGDKILDTHAGSASCLVACHKAGFKVWGFEICEGYYKTAKERLDREMEGKDGHEDSDISGPR